MRKARIIQEGAIYHVTARTNRREMLLGTPFSRKLFLKVLGDAKKKYDGSIENFVIMGNHFHLLVRPLNGTQLSEIMKWNLGIYTMGYNRIHGTWGHFWGGRYFSRPVTSFGEYVTVFTYIDNNPVKAQLAEDKLSWEWSGIRHHRSGRTDIVTAPSLWMKILWPEHEILRLGTDPIWTDRAE